MRALVQRVSRANVSVDGKSVGEIENGLCVLVGFHTTDNDTVIGKVTKKVYALRVFDDDNRVMNLSAQQLGLPLLVVSQFTLYGNTEKGNRPSWINAAKPEVAKNLYEKTVEAFKLLGAVVETGVFQAEMKVELVNDGPVTLMIESEN